VLRYLAGFAHDLLLDHPGLHLLHFLHLVFEEGYQLYYNLL
jgi:hypothetical protein